MYTVTKATPENLKKLPGLTHYVITDDGEVARGCANIHLAMAVCRELNEKSPWYQEWRKANKTA